MKGLTTEIHPGTAGFVLRALGSSGTNLLRVRECVFPGPALYKEKQRSVPVILTAQLKTKKKIIIK